MADEKALEDREESLVEQLRKEAYEVKDCFTRYSFQALAIVTAVVVLNIRYLADNTYVGFSAILLVALMQTVASIGTHKYSTANRLLGFELFLQRMRRCESRDSHPHWERSLRDVGWEEAMRSWRVVQPTLFRFLYITGTLDPRELKEHPQFKATVWNIVRNQLWRPAPETLRAQLTASDGREIELPAQRWFEPMSLMPESAAYYAGGYLQTMLNVIYVVSAMCMLPAFVSVYLLSQRDGHDLLALIALVFCAVFSVFTINRFRLTTARRILLERGLLSIHSCSIVWQVALTAHFQALDRLRAHGAGKLVSYKGYTDALSRVAVEAAEHVDDIHQWLVSAALADVPTYGSQRLAA